MVAFTSRVCLLINKILTLTFCVHAYHIKWSFQFIVKGFLGSKTKLISSLLLLFKVPCDLASKYLNILHTCHTELKTVSTDILPPRESFSHQTPIFWYHLQRACFIRLYNVRVMALLDPISVILLCFLQCLR